MVKKKLIIITGPQGSGNHLWAKILSEHPAVFGWNMKDYWEGHHHEPFQGVWLNEQSFDDLPLKDYNVTSISCPFVHNGINRIPEYQGFIHKAKKANLDVRFVVLSRDINILLMQQSRVRKDFTTPIFLEVLKHQAVDHFLSMETLFLYKEKYLHQLELDLGIPIDIEKAKKHIDETNQNLKYVHQVPEQPLDKEVKKAKQESMDFNDRQRELVDLNWDGSESKTIRS